MFNNPINILAAPNDAFTSIKEKPIVLFPLLLIMLFLASLQWAHFNAVDRKFLIDKLVEQAQAFANKSEGQLRGNLV